MDVRHENDELRRLETEEDFNAGLGQAVVRAYRKVISNVRRVSSSRILMNWRGLRLEKLKGDRKGQWSMRLNDQWRLIVEFEQQATGELVVVKEIVDYH